MILASSYPYTGNGLGGLPDAIEATVTHEINGQYEFFMRYPVTGLHYEDLISGRIIMAAPDDLTDEQPFRIYRITKPLNGIVSVYARHLCYDMQGIIVEPFTAGSMTEAFQTIPTVCTPSSPITLSTTRTVASGITLEEPRPLWKLLGGQAGSLLDVYGGEWEFDKDDAKLVTHLGMDRGVSIRYGKNMTEMEQDATIESSYSGVYPYWYDEESNTLVTLTEKYVTVAGSVVSDRVMILDCSSDFDDAPTEAQLRTRAQNYITNNSVGNVKASWKISFVDTTEGLDRIMLGDTLHVYYERLDVNATARAVKTEYNVLQGRYKSITVGKVKQNLASIIVENQEKTEEGFKEIKSDFETAVDDATDFIRHGAGYMRFIYNSSDELTEIVSLDDPDITQAQKVWRWNNGGFGFSSTGYSGQYTTAITQNGAIVCDFLTAGTLNANVIRAGILQDTLGKNSWNLQTGALTITDGSINIETSSEIDDRIKLNASSGSYEWYASMTPSWVELHSVDGTSEETAILTSGSITISELTGAGYTTSAGTFYADNYGWQVQGTDYASNAWVSYGRHDNITFTKNNATTLMLGGESLTFYDSNGNPTATYPDPIQFTASAYNNRCAIESYQCYKWGPMRFVSFKIVSQHSATNSPRMLTLGAANAPTREQSLSCSVLAGGSDVGDNIPCMVNTSGNIFLKNVTSGTSYLITGMYSVL